MFSDKISDNDEKTKTKVNEEGDAPQIQVVVLEKDNHRPEPPPQQPAQQQEIETPFNKQRLGAYKHFARTANRTLATFTNEMSEILRQSIERLDSISMKVRGCVYEIERQRVLVPLPPAAQELEENKENEKPDSPELQLQQEPLEEAADWEKQEEETALEPLPIEVTNNLISDIKEIAVKCMKTTSQNALNEKQSVQGKNLNENEGSPRPASPKKTKPGSKEEKRPRTTTKRNTTVKNANATTNEKEIMIRINKQHKKLQSDGITSGSKEGSVVEKPQTPRKRRKRGEPGAVPKKQNQRRARQRQSKKVNDAYTKENYSDSSWFGPKICATTSPTPRKKSAKGGSKCMRLTQSKDSSASRIEFRNTKLARKFASSNFHEAQQEPKKVESYTGGRVVRLTSDSKQDWSVIMHTQKAPTRYDLRQNSPLPTNNLLDEITLKDLEPLKAEYPRKDHIFGNKIRLEDTLLYKLVNGNQISMEKLIDVTAKNEETTTHNSQASFVTGQFHTEKRGIPNIRPMFNLPSTTPTPGSALPPSHVVPLSRPNTMYAVTTNKQIQAIPSQQAKGDDLRAGIYRSVEPVRRKPSTINESLREHSQRIVVKLSEIKSAVSHKNVLQNQQIYKQAGKKEARKRLKKYLGDPNKTHQKYMVLMVHSVTYDNYQIQDGKFIAKNAKSVEDILAKYIYLEDERNFRVNCEFTVAIATTGAATNPGSSKKPITSPKPLESMRDITIKPTRDRDVEPKQNRPFGPSHHRRGIAPTVSPPRTAPTTPKSVAEASWKNVIRSCYVQPHPQPPKRNDQITKSMDPIQIRNIISNMELQLKQVVENPKIENKEVVIKGLQEQMEWILHSLEGQTTALRKRKEVKPTNPNFKRKEPILKPKLPQVANSQELFLGGELKKTPGKTIIPPETDNNPPNPDDIQSKLMSKWQILENPSGESVDIDIDSLKDLSIPSTHSQNPADVKKAKSRPETRREQRSIRKSNSNLNNSSSQERYQSQHEGSLTRDGRRSISNTEKMLDQILAKIQYEEEEQEEEIVEYISQSDNESGDHDLSIYDSCADININEIPVKEEAGLGLSQEEISQYQENIKILETQLGEETQRFVDEMDQVIKQIESTTHAPAAPIVVYQATASPRLSHPEENILDVTIPNDKILELQTEQELIESQTDLKYIATKFEAIQIGQPLNIPLTSTMCMEVELIDEATDPPQVPPITLSHKEISLTLSHDMRRSIDQKRSFSIKQEQESKKRDYNLATPAIKESPMIQDIRKSLFGPKNTQKHLEQSAKALSNYSSRNFTKMPWETSDKATTTASMTNLDDFLKDYQESKTKLGPRGSKSEMMLKVTKADASRSSLKRVVQLVEIALSAQMMKIFNTESIESILSSTLEHQRKQLQTNNCNVREFAGFLTFVYSVMFAIMSLGLIWCPSCIAT